MASKRFQRTQAATLRVIDRKEQAMRTAFATGDWSAHEKLQRSYDNLNLLATYDLFRHSRTDDPTTPTLNEQIKKAQAIFSPLAK